MNGHMDPQEARQQDNKDCAAVLGTVDVSRQEAEYLEGWISQSAGGCDQPDTRIRASQGHHNNNGIIA